MDYSRTLYTSWPILSKVSFVVLSSLSVIAIDQTIWSVGQCTDHFCGVTCKPLTYCWLCAMRHMSLSKLRLLAAPKLKWSIMALRTRGWVLASPWVCASIASFQAMFWHRKLRRSISSGVIGWGICLMLAAMTVKESARTTKGHMITPWGEECWVISSKIAQNWY